MCAHADGFVPVQSLAAAFDAEIVIRPLLVEAMLASREGSGPRWVVLLDSERFGSKINMQVEETSACQLPARMRNSIAHELTHILDFIDGEDGPILKKTRKPTEDKVAFKTRIESRTEKFSPLLLIPQSVLENLAQKPEITLHDLIALKATLGVSREIFVSRLVLFSDYDPHGMRFCGALENMIFGVGEWESSRSAVLKSWPRYHCFRGNYVPPTEFPQDAAFYLNGGNADSVRWTFNDSYLQRQRNLQLTVERVERGKGKKFLFLLREL